MAIEMNWVYPKVRNVRKILPYLFYGALIGGMYGAIHDQISYTISKEYFTEFKFHQFHYADFNLSNRHFVGIIGFLATWWVGMICGWFLARIRFFSDNLNSANRDILKGFLLIFYFALSAGIVGGVVGYFNSYVLNIQEFLGWENQFSGTIFKRFVVVGMIHNFGYIGGLLGLIISIYSLKRKMKNVQAKR